MCLFKLVKELFQKLIVLWRYVKYTKIMILELFIIEENPFLIIYLLLYLRNYILFPQFSFIVVSNLLLSYYEFTFFSIFFWDIKLIIFILLLNLLFSLILELYHFSALLFHFLFLPCFTPFPSSYIIPQNCFFDNFFSKLFL